MGKWVFKKNTMNDQGRYFLHMLNNGSIIRGMTIEGRSWFCVKDFYRAARINYNPRLSSRLMLNEVARIQLDGYKMNCVSITGLLGLAPLRSDCSKLRDQIVEIIQDFPVQINPYRMTTHPDFVEFKGARVKTEEK
jgi:hypothetical protein